MTEIMTKAEIHDFGIEVVFGYLQGEGYEIVGVNADLSMNPQIVAKKEGQLQFIVVRTDCYPAKGILDASSKALCIKHALGADAVCYFASVGIANASGADDAEMSLPVKGAGFHISFSGLERFS